MTRYHTVIIFLWMGEEDLPHLILPIHMRFIIIFLFFSMLYNHESQFGRCPIFEITHSPRMVNNQCHAHTPDSTRCPRAYEMRICHFISYHVTCIMKATCNISKTWIIIFSTYNFHSLYIPCQYIKQAYINMIFHKQQDIHFSSNTP